MAIPEVPVRREVRMEAGSTGAGPGPSQEALAAPPVYLDGRFVPAEEARISVFDHGLLYGDGVFEGIRFYNGRIFRLEEHVERLYASAGAIGLSPPLSPGEMREAILATAARSGLRAGYLRPLVTRGVGDLGLDPRKSRRPSVIILCAPLTVYESQRQRGIRAVIASVRRPPRVSLDPNVKSLNYLNNILAKSEANLRGVEEALLLDLEGNLAEASGENVFLVRGRTLLTPPAEVCLKGITRSVILELARGVYRAQERPIPAAEIFEADEIFLTGTGAEVVPVVEVEGERIGTGQPGPVTRDLLSRYQEITHRSGTPIPYRIQWTDGEVTRGPPKPAPAGRASRG